MSSLIDFYGRQQKLRQVEDIFASAQGSPSKGKLLYRSMINAYVNCGKLDKANHLYKEMIDKGHSMDAVALSILVNALTKNGTCGLNS